MVLHADKNTELESENKVISSCTLEIRMVKFSNLTFQFCTIVSLLIPCSYFAFFDSLIVDFLQ